jgi:hypothetical protein
MATPLHPLRAMTRGQRLVLLLPALAGLAAACGSTELPGARRKNAPGESAREEEKSARADDVDPAAAEANEASKKPSALPPLEPAALTKRCAVRLSIALTGKSPDAAVFATKEVGPAVDRLLASPDFADRYARFTNAETNGAPAAASEDPVYFLAKHVIANDKPWSDLFTGKYRIDPIEGGMRVSDDPAGLGYFRSDAWLKRYAGNEPDGVMLSAAFRIFQNTTGLELSASVGNPDDDRTAKGRSTGVCKSCHFQDWYALDTAAKLLPTKKGEDMAITFSPPTAGPQQLLGKALADDRALVETLVGSDAWRFAQCRNVFKFMFGRQENKCEAVAFDRCVEALTNQKTIRAAVAALAKDPSVCK